MNSQYVLGRQDVLDDLEDSSTSFTSSIPPRECRSFEQLRAHLQVHAKKHGFACVTKVSHLKRENPDCTFQCSSGGSVRNNWGVTMDNRRRRTPSGRIGCPFKVRAFTVDPVEGDEDGQAKWTFQVIEARHNHCPASMTLPHPVHRRFNDEELEFLRSQRWSKTSRRALVDRFRHSNPLHPATRADVGNAMAKIRRSELAPLPSIPAALYWLDQHAEDWLFEAHSDASDRLDRLVFMNQEMVRSVKKWGSVLQMDCTYSTNKYRLPLLHVCGVTATGRTFTAGYALLGREDSYSYQWALETLRTVGNWPDPAVIVTDRELSLMSAIKAVFPAARNLLCRWHIAKAIKAKITEQFSKARDLEDAEAVDRTIRQFSNLWYEVFNAPTERELSNAWETFVDQCTQIDAWQPATRVFNYIVTTWMKHQQSFLLPFIDRVRHLGCRTTGRCEGNHGRMKAQLVTRNSKLHILLGTLSQHQMHEQREALDAIAKDRSKAMAYFMEDDFFARVVRKVSHFALFKLESEWRKRHDVGNRADGDCLCNFTVAYGIPCVHRIKYLWNDAQILQLNQFAAHWHLDRPQDILNGDLPDCGAAPPSLVPLPGLEYSQNDVDEALLAPRVRSRGFRPSQLTRRAASGRILNSFSQVIDQAVRAGRSNFDHTGKKVRRCGICKVPGHDRRKCPSAESDGPVDEEELSDNWNIDGEMMIESLTQTDVEATPLDYHQATSIIPDEYRYGRVCLVPDSTAPTQSQYAQSIYGPSPMFLPSSFASGM
ncbi:unnamed protein product [Parajaminaea phylloscopi]